MDLNSSRKDDPSIPDSEWLLKTVHPSLVKDGITVSSGAFKSHTNLHTSVELGSLTTPEETLKRRPGDAGVVRLVTGAVRGIRPGVLGVMRDPTPESESGPANPAHAIIIRQLKPDRVNRETAHRLADLCQWVIGPAPVQS
jgi:hypothetical protein